MAKDGPLDTPTTVLGFTDFVRTFSADTSQGELPDQVRQFFLNGGNQAIIVRIAAGAGPASVTLTSSGGTPVLTLTSDSAGTDQNALRVTVDYNTPNPERTFNLTIFRETLDSAGNATDSSQETISNVSMDPADPRYVLNILPLESALVTGSLPGGTALTASKGIAISGTVAATTGGGTSGGILQAFTDAVNALHGVGKFRVTLGAAGTAQTITVTTVSGTTLSAPDIQGFINAKFTPGAVTVDTDGSATSQYLRITAGSNVDVILGPGPDSDVSAVLGLGVAQGGIEFGAYSAVRPAPSGFVAVLKGTGTDTIGNLTEFSDATKSAWSPAPPTAVPVLTMVGPKSFSVPGNAVAFAGGADAMNTGTAVPGRPNATSLLNVQQNLQAVAAAINVATTNWHAELQGMRLALVPTFGDSQAGPGNSFPTTQPPGIADMLQAPTNTAAVVLAGGSDGTKPTETEYDAAYVAVAAQVEIFNLLVLPRSVGDTTNDRAAFWGPASSFCLQQRAFLIMDLDNVVTTVTQAQTAVKQARIGLVKDHAATYWPRLQINPDGNPRNIDASGTLAGIMARIDGTRGVWKAPAGLEASLTGVLGVTTKMSDPENGELNPEALNAIRVFPNGIVSWGARTMDGFDNSGDDDFKYIPVRRFELFIESSLVAGLRFAVFEPNAEPLWSTIRLSVTAFMNNLFRQGAFAGTTTRDSFFVKVDSETTTATDINLGIVNVVVGFAPLKPAEFVVITIQQQAGQVQV
ncbi:MAG TPA: phage tail sheath subtilisin-like domain-containing protein [Polyangia bacterium]|jgi:hypothetical protein